MFNTIIASVFMFGLLIFAHELGHFLAARRVGIHVIEFAVGFGPRLISWENSNTRYSIRIFPLGGFCRMLGEEPDESSAENSFQKQTVLKRFLVIAAGPAMNFLLAVLIYSLIYFFVTGIPLPGSTSIGNVVPGWPASEVGLKEGDTIKNIEGVAVNNWEEVVAEIHKRPQQKIEITFERAGETKRVKVLTSEDEKTGRGLIGIGYEQKKHQFFSSLFLGISNTAAIIKMTFISLWQMLTGQIPPDVAGPVGIIVIVGEFVETGLGNFLSLVAFISINLGIINLLPIPALDGSKLIFLAVEGLRGRPLDPKREGFIHFIGFTILILLMILIAFQDITRLFE